MRLIRRKLIVGETLGAVPDETPTVPLHPGPGTASRSAQARTDRGPKTKVLDLREAQRPGTQPPAASARPARVPWGTRRAGVGQGDVQGGLAAPVAARVRRLPDRGEPLGHIRPRRRHGRSRRPRRAGRRPARADRRCSTAPSWPTCPSRSRSSWPASSRSGGRQRRDPADGRPAAPGERSCATATCARPTRRPIAHATVASSPGSASACRRPARRSTTTRRPRCSGTSSRPTRRSACCRTPSTSHRVACHVSRRCPARTAPGLQGSSGPCVRILLDARVLDADEAARAG